VPGVGSNESVERRSFQGSEAHPTEKVELDTSGSPDRGDLLIRVAQYAAGLTIIVLITLSCRRTELVNPTTVGFVFLLAILSASAFWGLGVSAVMAVAATLCFDYYFLPPVGTFNINDPQDWVALFSFSVTAGIGSYLSAWARREARESNRRRQEVERLYDFSEHLLKTGNPKELLSAIPQFIVDSLHIGAVALFLSDEKRAYHAGLELPRMGPDDLEALAASQKIQAEVDRSVRVVPLSLSGREIGSLRLSGELPSQETIDAVATLILVAIERARTIEQAAKVEAARENEHLKSVLLDAITHDFRTPLTSIKGSVTGLLADLGFGREERRELLMVIDEECDRINKLVGAASEMARLEAGNAKLHLNSYSIGEIVSGALASCANELRERTVLRGVHDEGCLVRADLSLAKKVLVHLIDNAHLYSSPGQPITIATETKDGFVFFRVADSGPGIDEEEMARIFEKFYRGKGQRDRVEGTGRGLAIAASIIKALGGTIGAVSEVGKGSVFSFSLPLAVP
jgi:two-component system sensor histidine kinase KdpD